MAPFSKEGTILKWEKPNVWFQKFPNLICLSDNIKISVTYSPCGWCHSLKLREKQGVGWASAVRCDRKLHLSFRTTTTTTVWPWPWPWTRCSGGWATRASWHRRSWRKRWGGGRGVCQCKRDGGWVVPHRRPGGGGHTELWAGKVCQEGVKP